MSKKRKYIIGIFVFTVIAVGAYCLLSIIPPNGSKNKEGVFYPPMLTAQMQGVFKENGYDMANHIARNGKPIPRIFIQSVPKDFNRSKYDEVRPALFVEMLTPTILRANQKLYAERDDVLTLQKEFKENGSLSDESMEKLTAFQKRYDIKDDEDLDTVFTNLIIRVDGVAPTLLLAMAAEDSGWATSRYAREYNAIFNERDWDGNGIVPDEPQKEGPQYRIKTFPSLYDAILSQIHYMNTNGYLENFRIARLKYRRTNNIFRGYSNAHLLINFPYKPFKYPDIIKHLIDQYSLVPLDVQVLETAE